eukprot:jgi/Botrbrau1/22240/Bobra.0138s0002.1
MTLTKSLICHPTSIKPSFTPRILFLMGSSNRAHRHHLFAKNNPYTVAYST